MWANQALGPLSTGSKDYGTHIREERTRLGLPKKGERECGLGWVWMGGERK